MRYSEDPDLRADGHPAAERPRDRMPGVGERAKTMLAEADSLVEALFDLAEVFRVPVTNNLPWFEDGDIDRPVYEIDEFIEQVQGCFLRAGWTPPPAAADDATAPCTHPNCHEHGKSPCEGVGCDGRTDEERSGA